MTVLALKREQIFLDHKSGHLFRKSTACKRAHVDGINDTTQNLAQYVDALRTTVDSDSRGCV